MPERSPYEPGRGLLRRRATAKWATYEDDVLPAWVAEMDFGTAPDVQAALRDAVETQRYGYPPKRLAEGVATALGGWLRASAGWETDPQRIHVLPDVLKGIELAITTLSRSDSAVIVPTPSYPPFFGVVRFSGRDVVEAPMRHAGMRWELDLDAIDAAFARGAGTIILCNPHNPLGRAFGPDELRDLAEVVERHGARVVADEVHAPLTYPDARWTPYATVSEAAAAHSVSLVSGSKGWNLPGLKCAQIVLNTAADADAWRTLSMLAGHGASILGMVANQAAYERGRRWLAETVAYLHRNRGLLDELLRGHLPGVAWTPPQATYLGWLDCRRLGLADPARFFLERARVACNDGAAFGSPGRGFVRLNFATSRSTLEEIVTRMGEAVAAGAAAR